MKVLFASRYVDPVDSRANKIIIQQAKCLMKNFEANVEILTWPHRDHWRGPLPTKIANHIPLRIKRKGISYAIFLGKSSWNELAGGNCISDGAWEEAIAFGMKILNHLKPDIFHLHHRFGFWWMLESAQRLGIPTIYTNYDWGIACLRTVLVNGDGEICDGHINPEKCSTCIRKGRTKYLARINEALVNLSIGEKLLSVVENINPNSDFFRSRGFVTKSSFQRTSIHQGRLKTVINQLSQLITPSKFGKDFFGQFGISRDNVTILPWFHDVSDVDKKSSKKNGGMILTYIGRLSPEKGVHLIFEALELLNDIPMITLRINSYNDSDYCRNLREKYKSSAGKHHVIWNKWNADWLNVLDSFYTTDLVIIPSNCMDNTPLVFIESMAYKVPVIATRIPTMSDFENNENVCYFADFNSAESFSVAIRRALSNLKLIRKGGQNFPSIPTSIQYCDEIYKIYKKML